MQELLSEAEKEAITAAHAQFADWFALLARCDGLGMVMLQKLPALVKDHQKLVSVTMACRVLQSLRAGNILAARGMAADARGQLRNASETAIFLLKMERDASFDDRLIENFHYHQQKEANALLNDASICAELSQEQQASLRETLAEIKQAYPNQKPRQISVAATAASADAMALYTTIFQPTSNDSAHTSIKSLGRHFTEQGNGQYLFRFGPQFEDAESTLGGLANVYLFVLMSIAHGFKLTEHENDVLDIHLEFKRIAKLDGSQKLVPSAASDVRKGDENADSLAPASPLP